MEPKKSKTLKEINIPDEFFFDFVRGVFDGDGCIYSFWDKRWKSSFMFYIQIVSASPKFLKWLQEEIERLVGISGHISRCGSIKALKFAKEESKILLGNMYYQNSLPCSKRKFTKSQKILELDRDNNKSKE